MAKPPQPPVPTPSPRSQSRATATFVPYFWEAYNEIVEPRRFDHYLLRRWLPELGPLGLAIVKALRDRCYHNPTTGILRNECEVKMVELAAQCGVNRATLFREFERNKALAEFVQRFPQYQLRGGKMVQAENAFRISMDEPIHKDDYERYDQLRAEREKERQTPPQTSAGRRLKGDSSSGSQNATQNDSDQGAESQSATLETTSLQSHGATADATHLGTQDATPFDHLPSGGILTKESLTDEASGISPINPPGDDAGTVGSAEESGIQESLLCGIWNGVLRRLSRSVNKPTFETHIRMLGLLALDKDAGTAQIAAPSAFSRQYIEGRHRQHLEEAFTAELGREISVTIVLADSQSAAMAITGLQGK